MIKRELCDKCMIIDRNMNNGADTRLDWNTYKDIVGE